MFDQVPVVRSIALNYGTGRLQVYLSETLLPPPSSNQVNLHFGNLRTPFYHQVHVNIAAVVREVFVIHVGGTRCVTSSTDNIMKIRARITLIVEVIRGYIFIFLFYV